MKSLLVIALVAWSFWAGYTVVHAGYWFGVLLPAAGTLMFVGQVVREGRG